MQWCILNGLLCASNQVRGSSQTYLYRTEWIILCIGEISNGLSFALVYLKNFFCKWLIVYFDMLSRTSFETIGSPRQNKKLALPVTPIL